MFIPYDSCRVCIMRLYQICAAAMLLIETSSVRGGPTFFEDFNSGVLNPLLNVTTDSGFNVNFAGGQAVFSKSAGTGNGSGNLNTNFQASGDFNVSVDADRGALGNAELGLLVGFYPLGFAGPSSGYADIFFVRNNQINGNITLPSYTVGSVSDSRAQTTFQINRTGATITESYQGNVVNSQADFSLTVPVSFSLFLIEEFGDSNASSGSFDNWFITADQFEYPASAVPEPASWVLAALGIASGFGYLRRRRRP